MSAHLSLLPVCLRVVYVFCDDFPDDVSHGAPLTTNRGRSTLHTERTEGRRGDSGKFSFLERLGVLVQSQARRAVNKFAGLVINTNLCAELLRQGGWQRIRMFIFQYDHNPPS